MQVNVSRAGVANADVIQVSACMHKVPMHKTYIFVHDTALCRLELGGLCKTISLAHPVNTIFIELECRKLWKMVSQAKNLPNQSLTWIR